MMYGPETWGMTINHVNCCISIFVNINTCVDTLLIKRIFFFCEPPTSDSGVTEMKDLKLKAYVLSFKECMHV